MNCLYILLQDAKIGERGTVAIQHYSIIRKPIHASRMLLTIYSSTQFAWILVLNMDMEGHFIHAKGRQQKVRCELLL
jgi:hypothetical protein